MGYSIDASTQDCYEGTTCLINKFGIKDEIEFSKAESVQHKERFSRSLFVLPVMI